MYVFMLLFIYLFIINCVFDETNSSELGKFSLKTLNLT